MTNKKPKLLLVGWDAADWRIINPLLQQGKLPGLARLMANAAWGNLVTIDPVISPMLWTSIATGKRPYKHGIHGFTEVADDGESVRPVRVSQRKCKAIWNILNDHGYKTNVIGWWPSHPAEHVDGCSVSNFFAIPPRKDTPEWPVPPGSVYPEELTDRLGELRLHPAELTPQIMANFFPEATNLLSDNDPILRSAMRILAHASSVQAAATEVMETTEWDFMAVYFDALDHFSHLGMKYHPPQLKGVSDEQFKNYHYVVEAAYRFHDMMLERLMDLAGAACQVMLVSDHGFESGNKRMLNLPDEPGAPALEHRPYGVFAASGVSFQNGQVYGASLLDITPTVLNVFGLKSATDMDGVVLKSALINPVEKEVESYEGEHSNPQPMVNIDAQIDAQMMDQLVALGYINKPETETEKQVALSENEYYLARSLADGGLLNDALAKMETLCQSFPEIDRYANFKASLLLRLGQFEQLNVALGNRDHSPFVTYLNGVSLLQQQKPLLAAQQFDSLKEIQDSSIQVKMALTWFQAGEMNRAEHHAKRALAIDPDEIQGVNLLAEIKMFQEQFEDALGLYFQSLKLVYYQPKVHEQIGQCLQHLNHTSEAAQAYELSLRLKPGNYSVIQKLTDIYVNDQSKINRFRELQKSRVEVGVVVTGFPRSGTSLMMQILKVAGIAVLTDDKREADANNEQGYFELDAVKNALVDQTFLQDLPGKAIKVVFPLLRFLKPAFPLKVIWMDRDFGSTLKSQENMKKVEPKGASFQLLENMQKERALHESWLNQHDHVSYLHIKYENLIQNPKEQVNRLSRFLNLPGHIEELITVVNPKMKHF